jgi:hypothetical protein
VTVLVVVAGAYSDICVNRHHLFLQENVDMGSLGTSSAIGFPICPKTGIEVVPLWIDGVAVPASKEQSFPVYSAKQEKNVFMAQSANAPDATRAADVALKSFTTWRATSADHRQSLLLKAADILESRKAEAIRLQVEETSCEASWAGFNVGYRYLEHGSSIKYF